MNVAGVSPGSTVVMMLIIALVVVRENTVTQHRPTSIKARTAQIVLQENILPQPARPVLRLAQLVAQEGTVVLFPVLAQLVAQENTLPQPALPVI